MRPGKADTAATLGHRLRELRSQQGLALSEVARRAGISKAYLSQLEHGASSHPSYDVMVRLATALGITVGELTGRPAVWEPMEGEPLPASLRAFAEGADIPKTDVSMLSKIHFRGKRPRSPEDWAHIYETIRRTIR